jgi:hypothetical protein
MSADDMERLQAALDSQQKDTARLDAIERHKLDVLEGDGSHWAVFLSDRDWVNAPTLREAIDAAIAKKEGA